jgi:hypothetical protein
MSVIQNTCRLSLRQSGLQIGSNNSTPPLEKNLQEYTLSDVLWLSNSKVRELSSYLLIGPKNHSAINDVYWSSLRINPNWTGLGQSWPCRLWPQIAGKRIKYFIFLFYLFLQKRLSDLFELMTWPQKMTFWRPFWRIFVRSPATVSQAGQKI